MLVYQRVIFQGAQGFPSLSFFPMKFGRPGSHFRAVRPGPTRWIFKHDIFVATFDMEKNIVLFQEKEGSGWSFGCSNWSMFGEVFSFLVVVVVVAVVLLVVVVAVVLLVVVVVAVVLLVVVVVVVGLVLVLVLLRFPDVLRVVHCCFLVDQLWVIFMWQGGEQIVHIGISGKDISGM